MDGSHWPSGQVAGPRQLTYPPTFLTLGKGHRLEATLVAFACAHQLTSAHIPEFGRLVACGCDLPKKKKKGRGKLSILSGAKGHRHPNSPAYKKMKVTYKLKFTRNPGEIKDRVPVRHPFWRKRMVRGLLARAQQQPFNA